jgi:hypothetical protein
MRDTNNLHSWANTQFRHVDLGDPRRDRRLIEMGAQAARSPAGKVSDVYRSAASRQAAYDFLESDLVTPSSIAQGVGVACAKQCAELAFAFLPTDGSTATIVDRAGNKGLGSVGARGKAGPRGVKVVSVVALDPAGVPVGVAAQEYWARPVRPRVSRREQKKESRRRRDDEKETRHWLDAITHAGQRFDEAGARGWFLVDREGDARPVLQTLASTGHLFTVRSRSDRALENVEGLPSKLRARLAQQPVFTEYDVEVPAAHQRRARTARMQVRVLDVTLRMRVADTRHALSLPVTALWAREVGTTPPGEKALDWLLFTNYPVRTPEQANLVVYGYTMRWRIEEVHKAWKSGTCHIEDTQLRSCNAFVRWATILFAVATRAERLKHLSRDQPDLPASVELSKHEIRALILLKRRQKKRTELVPDTMPTLAQATRWIADLGGYNGKSSGGPPGVITIQRGLLDVRAAADLLEQLEREHGGER